jgi:hypothetical protein
MGRKGNKKRAAKQKFGDSSAKKYDSQSDVSDTEPSREIPQQNPTIFEESVLDVKGVPVLSASQPRTSLLSQQATMLQHPQPIRTQSTLEDVIQGKPTVSTEQKISQSIGKDQPLISRSIPKSSSLSRSIPKSIPRRNSSSYKVATPSSIFHQIHRKSLAESDSENEFSRQEVTEIVAEHLVNPDEVANKTGTSFGSMSHQLVGGIKI